GILFKRVADIDVFDIEVNETSVEGMVKVVSALEPTFGGINLEDIKAPECFEIEKQLIEKMNIPVFHDDQHGTAIIASAGFFAFQLLLSIIYPLIIAPLFNKFSPLEEGPLKDSLYKLADKLNFRTRGIYVMDGSRRSGHSNAYFTGIGKSKRIVLYDTLISSLSDDQIAAVLAHEIGHYKKHHLLKSLILSFMVTGAGFYIVSILMNYLPLFEAFGFSRVSYHGIFVILSFAAGPFTFFLTPLFTMWSRKHEYEADAFTARNTGYGNDLKEGLIIMTRENLSNLTPHPLYSFYHYSHPTVAERVKAIEKILNS
ncbi:MAG: M48 family metalloprotease, partial [Spirochaetales bacterium]|nr:M48 family metalloprotease [Spirochaetales bacterium]